MPTQYACRLLCGDPAGTAALASIPNAPGHLRTYGPGRYVCSWPGASDLSEQLVEFTDPDESGNISNTSQIDFRVRGDSHRWELTHVGLFPANAVGANRSQTLMDVLMLAPAIAWPGGRMLAEPNSQLTVAPGALIFTPS